MIQNFYETIFEFDFDITYTSGMDNILADRRSVIFVPDTKKLEGSVVTKRNLNVPPAVSPENEQQDTDLFIYASHLDVYETPKDEEQKKELLEKSYLLGHYGITAMEQIIYKEYQMLRKGESIAANAQIEQRLSLPYTPYGNSAREAAVKSAKAIIIKILGGCAENWDLYLDGTAYSLNLHKSRLYSIKPSVVMFAKLPNELKDYSAEQLHLPEKELDTKELKDKIKRIDKILVPAIKEQIVRTQKADNAYFMKRHRILEKPFPIGASVMIKNNGSYILKDKTNTFLSRDVPTSQIKLIDMIPNPENNPADAEYEVQAIINHRGEAPNYEYLVR
ncbi:hypothetical protein [Parasitella parasitica]|uniref:Integrase catalytic domain-containing protein n=1 Tax=Parasitella parasitica TaxID=35722 RepID=A0A0B7N1B4_9FUNG|nr:hypothetical protein [Parasitella parasitica]